MSLGQPQNASVDEDGFENATAAPEVVVASTPPPGTEDLDDRTRADVRRAAAADRITVHGDRVDGRLTVGSGETHVVRGQVNGGVLADNASTVATVGDGVNGETRSHNLIADATRFNGGVDATGP